MPDRFPPLELDAESGREIDEEVKKHYGSNPNFKWKDDTGAPIGPFAVVSYTPNLLRPWLMLCEAVLDPKTLHPLNRELICLAVTAVFDVPYIQYAHKRIGAMVGLSQAQIASAIRGTVPDGLTATEGVVYATALKLARARGPLDNESWREAEKTLGKEGAARVGHAVAWFVYNCTLLNLGAVDVPSS